MNSKINKGHRFIFFLLPQLFTTCLSSFCGLNSKQKRKKITKVTESL
ncbi:unnamed protein product [Malus baccata var. baccata]